MSRGWPLFDLRLADGDLTLRPFTEADLPALTALLPGDVELDPGATRLTGLDAGENRALVVRQDYWRAWGTWRPEAWTLRFAVLLDGELVGHQGLEGEDFLTLRTVDSSSWLVPALRGRGVGVRMRAAVLALAFGPLQASYAVSSAWHDNVACPGRWGTPTTASPGRCVIWARARPARRPWCTCG